MSNNKLIEITSDELSKANDNMLTTNQLGFLLAKTPENHTYKRPAKGGGQWTYVTGTYMKKVLNLMFGWNWSFEVVEHKFDLNIGQAYVLGKLTVNSQGRSIVKMQFGRVDIKFKKELSFNADGTPKMAKTRDGKEYHAKEPSDKPLDLGNDLKAATTDALKKCASELGIASDVYAPNEFKEIKVVEPKTEEDYLNEIIELLADERLLINEDDRMNVERIIEQKEVLSYQKTLKILKTKINNNGQSI